MASCHQLFLHFFVWGLFIVTILHIYGDGVQVRWVSWPVPYSINVVSEPFGPAVVLALQPDTESSWTKEISITQMQTRRALKAPAKLLCWLWTSQNTEDQPLPTATDDFTDCGNRFPTSWILYLLTQTLHLKIKSKLYSSEKVRSNTPSWEGGFYSTRCHCWTENILLGCSQLIFIYMPNDM